MARLMVLEQQGLDATSSKLKGAAGTSVLMRGMRRRTWTGPAWLGLMDGNQVS